MDSRIYRHYGNTHFDKSLFAPARNSDLLPKPKGGFWASEAGSKNGWETWCKQEEYEDIDDLIASKEYFDFTISPIAKILTIDSLENLKMISGLYGIEKTGRDAWSFLKSRLSEHTDGPDEDIIYLDFEKISEEYDAVEVLISSDERLYSALYGWDCDSICIFHSDIVNPLIEKEKSGIGLDER